MVVAARALHPPLLLIHALLHEDSGDRRRDGANRKRKCVCVCVCESAIWSSVGCRLHPCGLQVLVCVGALPLTQVRVIFHSAKVLVAEVVSSDELPSCEQER